MYPNVPKKIKESLEDAKKEVIFVLFSNQLNLNSKISERAAFESKIDSVISKLGINGICPIISLFSTKRDNYRKPCIGMWNILKNEILKTKQCTISESASYFVGDAAGRLANWKPGKSADWSGVDRKFALNVGLTFLTPEEHFLNEPQNTSFDLGRNPKSFSNTHEFDTNRLYRDDTEMEMIIVVGLPASGKSTLFKRFFESMDYTRVNRDSLGTMAKCISLVRSSLSSGKSVYIDNTSPTCESRVPFVAIAKEHGIHVRCFQFIGEEELCRHLNVFRSITQNIEPLPAVAFNSFKANYRVPELDEGFESILQVPFTAQFESETELDLFKQYLH